jgi:hypothetical protein
MERPSSARIWQPLLDERPKVTPVPKAVSTADLSIAWQTGLGSSLPEVELEEDDGEDEVDVSVSVGDGDDPVAVGELVRPPPPDCTSEATVPVPDTTWAQAAVVQAANSRARLARIRRAVMNRSSLVLRVVMRRVAPRLSTHRPAVVGHGDRRTPCAVVVEPTG